MRDFLSENYPVNRLSIDLATTGRGSVLSFPKEPDFMLRLLTAIIELITALVPRRTIVDYGAPPEPEVAFDYATGPSLALRTRRMLGGLVGAIVLLTFAFQAYPDYAEHDLPWRIRIPLGFFVGVFLWQLMHVTETLYRRLFM